MTNKLTPLDANWQKRIVEARINLEAVRSQLVDSEAELAERLARINRFEFNLRTRLGHLVSRLEDLEREIKKLRQELRLRADDWGEMDGRTAHWRLSDFETSQTGEFRYRKTAVPPPPTPLGQDTKDEIKQQYRELARRFHPDMAMDEADRAYRTQMMMAINAAYTARDLEKLQTLALEPDASHLIDTAQTDAQLHKAIWQEIARCQRRLAEIEADLARLDQHRSSQLMAQQKMAEAEGGDFWVGMESQLQDQIARRQVERDVLKVEMEGDGETAVGGNEWADTVWDLTLEYAFETEPDIAAEEIIFRGRAPQDYDEDNPDVEW